MDAFFTEKELIKINWLQRNDIRDFDKLFCMQVTLSDKIMYLLILTST